MYILHILLEIIKNSTPSFERRAQRWVILCFLTLLAQRLGFFEIIV